MPKPEHAASKPEVRPTGAAYRGPVVQAVLAIIGLAVTAISILSLPLVLRPMPVIDIYRVLEVLALGTAAGFALRVLRRFAFFRSTGTLHQSLSFEAIFQGAIAFNPQLEYPAVESAFLNRIGRMPSSVSNGWFDVRSTSAVGIPLVLVCIALSLSNQLTLALFCLAVAAAWSWNRARKRQPEEKKAFLVAEALGIAAAVVEGLAFVLAGVLCLHTVHPYQLMLLYLVLLSAYEFSPIPFALGVLELGYVFLAVALDFTLPGLAVVLLYRAYRLLVLPITLFYLPRYKLNLKDIFDPSLAVVLRKIYRPEGGWNAPEQGDSDMFLSIVIPAYNEAERLPVYLPHVIDYCQRNMPCEILVVDDGSTDSTAKYVEDISQVHSFVHLLRQPKNLGKGAAVKRGALEARGSYILFADADGATPIEEADRLLQQAKTGIEVVIASRTASGGNVKRSLLRSLVGATFYRFTNLLAVPMVSDTQCGFKLFRGFAARKVFTHVKETGWAFDVEVLFLAQKYDYAIVEVPVEWRAVAGSKVNLVKDSLSMLWALGRIRRRNAGLTEIE